MGDENKAKIFKLDTGSQIKITKKGKIKLPRKSKDYDGIIKLNSIFNAIDAAWQKNGKIDGDEWNLVNKLYAIIGKDQDKPTINSAELDWLNTFTNTDDVKKFIEDRYNELFPEGKAEEVVTTLKEQNTDNKVKQVVEVTEEEAAGQAPAAAANREATAKTELQNRNAALNDKVATLANELEEAVTAQGAEYTVREGDRLWNIAVDELKKQEITKPTDRQIIDMLAKIKKLNPELDINFIKIGQKIKLPAKAVTPPAEVDFKDKTEAEQIAAIKDMSLQQLDDLAGRVVYKGNDDKDGDLKDLGNNVKKAIVKRAVELYKEGKGDPANLTNLLKIRTLIKWVNFGEEELPASDKLVQVPDGTKDKDAAQKVFNAANALLAEVANCKPEEIEIEEGRGSEQKYKWKNADYNGKWINFIEYDSGEIEVRIYYKKDNNGSDIAEVKYVFDGDNMTGYADTEHTSGKYGCIITGGIEKEAILALVNKVFNNDPTKEQLRDDILETFFEVTGESEDKTYKFNPTKPMNADEQKRFEEVLNESGNEKMKAAYKAYLDNQKAAGLVTVPKGTPEGVQEVFDEANEFLTELANMENKPGVVSERFSDHYEFKTAVGGKKVTICKYDDGTIKIYINSNTDKRYTRASGVKYDANEVMYEIGKNGKIIGWYNNIDYSNEAMDGKITEGIDQAAIEELARKIFNNGEKAESFQDVGNYYVGARIGYDLYKQVKGAGSGDGADILNGGEITKDNIIGVIEGFNAKGSLYDDQCITEFLRNELFLTKDTVLKPANYLLKKAESVNLTNSPEYTNLKKAMEDYRSYPFDHYAQEVDKCIDALINKIKEIEAKK